MDETLLKIGWLLKIPTLIRKLFESQVFFAILVSVQIALLAADLVFLEIPRDLWVKSLLAQLFLLFSLIVVRPKLSSRRSSVRLSRVWVSLGLIALGMFALTLVSQAENMWDGSHLLLFFPTHNSSGYCLGALTVLAFIIPSTHTSRKTLIIFVFAFLTALAGSRSSIVAVVFCLLVSLFQNREFWKKSLPSVVFVVSLFVLNQFSPLYFSVHKVKSEILSTSFEVFEVLAKSRTPDFAIDVESFVGPEDDLSEAAQERAAQSRLNIDIRFQIWQRVLDRPLNTLLFGDLNYQCDEWIRFMPFVEVWDEIKREGSYRCNVNYVDFKGLPILNSAHNAFLHVLAKYGVWGIFFYSISGAYLLARIWPRRKGDDQSSHSLYIFIHAVIYGVGTSGVFSLIGSLGVLAAAITHRVKFLAEEK